MRDRRHTCISIDMHTVSLAVSLTTPLIIYPESVKHSMADVAMQGVEGQTKSCVTQDHFHELTTASLSLLTFLTEGLSSSFLCHLSAYQKGVRGQD